MYKSRNRRRANFGLMSLTAILVNPLLREFPETPPTSASLYSSSKPWGILRGPGGTIRNSSAIILQPNQSVHLQA